MSSHEPSANGNPPPKPDAFEMNLEPVDAGELNIDDVPTVESVEYVKPRRPGFGFWKAVLWCLLFLLVTQGLPAVIIGVGLFVRMVSSGESPISPDEWMKTSQARRFIQAAMLFIQVITTLFSLLMLRWVVGKQWKRRIALRLPGVEHVLLVAIGLPALLLFSIPIEGFVSKYVPSLSRFGLPGVDDFVKLTSVWPWSLAVLIIGVGPAIGEELWCRGFLGQGLAARFGTFGSVLLTSFLFGLIHFEPPQAIMAMLIGLVLHLSYLATRSLLIPMLIHFANNSLVVLNISETGHVPFLQTLETAYQHRPWLSVLSALLVLVAVGLALYRTRVRIVAADGSEPPLALFPNVEIPPVASSHRPAAGPIPIWEVGMLVVVVGLFVAVWFGF